MSYKYYEEELKRLPPNDPYGLSIQVRAGNGEHTKWLSLTDECKDALRKFITVEKPWNPDNFDPESMTDAQMADYWHGKWEEISRQEERARTELAKYLTDPICPATWHHIVGAVRELLLFRDCAKKAQPRRAILSDPDHGKEGDSNYVNNNLAVCLEFLNLAERRRT